MHQTRISNHSYTPEPIGKRIARLRSERGWTQQALAARLAISRVAISHIEMDLTIPGERTIILLAGLFKLSPLTLVDGTTYPLAKAERLPQTVCCYSQFELDLVMLKNDLNWLESIALEPSIPNRNSISSRVANVFKSWTDRLKCYDDQDLDEQEQEQLSAARLELKRLAELLPKKLILS